MDPQGQREELLRKIEDLWGSGVDTFLQADLLARLTKARLSALDLAKEMFPEDSSRAGYMRVVRALGALERQGYVTKALFGKEKPYRLTPYGRERISATVCDATPSSLISRKDLAAYVSTISATVGVAIATTSSILSSSPDPMLLIVCWFGVGILAGMCLLRFVQTIRRLS